MVFLSCGVVVFILLNACDVQGGIDVPYRRSPKPGPLSQGNLSKKREGKGDVLLPPTIGLQRPPETPKKPTSVHFEEAVAEEVSPSTPLDTTPNAFPAPVS